MDIQNFPLVPMPVDEIVDRLFTFPVFQGVPREEVEYLARVSKVRDVSGFTMKPGDSIEQMLIVLQGRFRTFNIQNSQQKELMTNDAGSISGLVPFSRMTGSPVFGETVGTTIALLTERSEFKELIRHNYELTAVFVHALIDRARQFTSFHFQSEKLMALGNLSAGLAHELNNPVAAIVRSAEDLHAMGGSLSESLGMIRQLPIAEDEWVALCPIFEERAGADRPKMSLIDRNRREDELTDWLGDHDIPEEYSVTLVDGGYTTDDLDRIASAVRPEILRALLQWLEKQLRMDKIVEEIAEAGRRISALVTSIKSYTRMDQVHDMQDVSINEGIRNTLMILQHKARKNSVTIHEELSDAIPNVRGFPGELTQVWTNLIDNALDAMKSGGDLYLSTGVDGRSVFFNVRDTGSGIPKENVERIFDPFFTTKDVGEGTGVGLDIVQKVVTSHKATIAVHSEPGRTEFRVCFPLPS
jgi:signal transduction histidine kinase